MILEKTREQLAMHPDLDDSHNQNACFFVSGELIRAYDLVKQRSIKHGIKLKSAVNS